MLICETYRFHGHHVGDINREYYRSKKEEQEWKAHRDPVPLFENWLTSQGVAKAEDMKKIQEEVTAEMAAAVKFAIDAPYPAPDKVDQDIYA